MVLDNSEKRQKLKYNFVFLFAWSDYWPAMLGTDSEQVRVRRTAIEAGPLLEQIFHYHWAYSLNEKIRMPLKKLWFTRIYNQGFNNDLPICFIFMGGNNIRYDAGFCDYIRRKDPRNRIVVLHEDLIVKKIDFDYEEIRRKADLCVTYDQDEAAKYGITYFPGLCYQQLVNAPKETGFEQDVYFLGAAKDRLPQIERIYHYLTENGVKCKFQIANVPPEQRFSGEGVEYVKYIPYQENLQNVIHSKCILEISQQGANGISVRPLEALSYGRRLITDCNSVEDEWFHPGQLQRMTGSNSMDLEFIWAPMQASDYPVKIDLDPIQRLFFIQDELEKKHG